MPPSRGWSTDVVLGGGRWSEFGEEWAAQLSTSSMVGLKIIGAASQWVQIAGGTSFQKCQCPSMHFFD